MTNETKDPAIGRLLGGQYRIESSLGQGGMGSVYRAIQLSVNRAVAVKLITGGSSNNAELVERFRREAKATAQLSHPNTVRLFDFGVTENQELFIVMELLEGRDLAAQLEASGALPIPMALQITRQVLASLSEAHARGIVHRDLKPGNIFLSQVSGGDTIAKVMDFGVAGVERACETHKLTTTGAVIGTPAYMSPEQAQGKPVDARADFYSLGVVLYEMLSGRPLFEADTVVSLLLLHVTQPPPRLTVTVDDQSRLEEIQRFLDRLLAKTPEERPPSAEHAIAEVDALLTAENGSRRQDAGIASGLAYGQYTATVQAETPMTWMTPQDSGKSLAMRLLDKRLASVIGGVGVMIALVIGAFWAFKPSPPAPSVQKPASPARETSQPKPTRSEVHTVTIASTPSSARVILGGAELGTTPYVLKFRNQTEIVVERQGYTSQTLTVSPNSEPNIVVTLVAQPKTSKSSRAKAKATTARPKRASTKPKARATTNKVTAAVTAPSNSSKAQTQPVEPTTESRGTPRTVTAKKEPPPAPASGRSAVGDVAHAVEDATNAVGNFVTGIFGSSDPNRRTRREAMLKRPPPYPNVMAAKRAYAAKRITAQQYEDAIWVLKMRRKQRIEAEKAKLRARTITKQEYEQRVQRINTDYKGQ